ncbi:hypothetical protein JL720_16611 [Aureococcus anophagefferens]|nr:hypothetical protein JL720_16611 [Aureococcus anophagefferens]
MAFANLVLVYNSGLPDAERVAHYFEFTFAVLSSFVTFWFCLDNRAMGEEGCASATTGTVDHKICMSMSDYHPESWNPSWSVSTILKGVLSFMLGDEVTTGAVEASAGDRRALAAASAAWNASRRIGALRPSRRTRTRAAKLAALGVGAAPGAAAGKKKKPRKKKK